MKKNLSVIMFCFLASVDTTVWARSIDVRPAGREMLEVNPKEIAATTFRITNNTNKEHQFVANIELPQGWMLITEDFPFYLQPNQSVTKPVSFFVPEMSAAGRYNITYSVRVRKYPSIYDSYTIDVVVLPRERLEVKLSEFPQCVIAGQEYQVDFLVANKSASANTVGIDVDSSSDIPFKVDSSLFSLGPGQSKMVFVTIRPDAELAGVLKYRLQLTAHIIQNGRPKTSARAAYSTEIIPCANRPDNLSDIIALNAAIGKLNLKSKPAEVTITPQIVRKEPAKKPAAEQEQKTLMPLIAAATDLVPDDISKKKMLKTATT